MKVFTRDENDPVGGPAQEMGTLFERSLVKKLTEMKENGIDGTANHLYVATMAISMAINLAAKLMTMPEGDNIDAPEVVRWAEGPVSRDGILVACLLVARCTKPTQDGLDFEFGPRHTLAAIKAAELIVGHNIDDGLTPGMVRAARQQVEPVHLFDNTTVDVSNIRTLH